MAEVSFHGIVSAVQSDSNHIAASIWSDVGALSAQGNFNQVMNAVNANNLNSKNYGISSDGNGFLSQHFSVGQIRSDHISDSAVVAEKVNDGAVLHDNLNLKSSDNGVRVLQVGEAQLKGVRVSQVQTVTITGSPWTYSAGVTFSDSPEGDPGFIKAPILMGVPFLERQAAVLVDIGVKITALDKTSVAFLITSGASGPGSESYTINIVAMGEVNA